MKALVCILLLLLFCRHMRSANEESDDSIQTKPVLVYSTVLHTGYLLPTWSFIRGKFKTDGPAFCRFYDASVMVLKQTDGSLPIEQIFHYPRYGFGIYTGQFFKGDYLSNPWGVFGMFIGSLAEWKRLSFQYSILTGLTGNWNHYDPTRNNFNTTLANDFTTHIDLGLRLNCAFSQHVEVGLGGSFAHFSNGAMEIPNFGINMLSPELSLTYLPRQSTEKRIRRILPAYLKNTYLDLALYGGEKHLPYPECDLDTAHNFFGFHYPQFGLTAVLNRNISYVLAVGLGLHVGYDPSKNTRYEVVDNRIRADLGFRSENIHVGLISSLEVNFDKVAFVIQPCYSIFKQESTFKKPDFFGKFGLKFKLWEAYYAGMQLHTFKLHADFIEFSLGYRLPITRRSN